MIELKDIINTMVSPSISLLAKYSRLTSLFGCTGGPARTIRG